MVTTPSRSDAARPPRAELERRAPEALAWMSYAERAALERGELGDALAAAERRLRRLRSWYLLLDAFLLLQVLWWFGGARSPEWAPGWITWVLGVGSMVVVACAFTVTADVQRQLRALRELRAADASGRSAAVD